jgi:hypothetical protein
MLLDPGWEADLADEIQNADTRKQNLPGKKVDQKSESKCVNRRHRWLEPTNRLKCSEAANDASWFSNLFNWLIPYADYRFDPTKIFPPPPTTRPGPQDETLWRV